MVVVTRTGDWLASFETSMRTGPSVGETVGVAVGGSGENSPVSFERFAEYVNGSTHLGDKYWLTVRDGWVTSVEFQFFS